MSNPPFGIRELAERAREQGAYDLAQGVIDLPPPPVVIEAVRQLPLEKYSRYNNKRGVVEYREAIKNYLESREWVVPIPQILATNGVTGALVSALLSDCKPRDTVLLPEPFFIGHKLLLQTLGFKIQFSPDFWKKITDEKWIEETMQNVKALILTTPANPTGSVALPELLARLSKQAAQAKCLLLIDEMYREFIWQSPPKNDAEYTGIDFSSTVLTRSFSKTLAIPGWRIGFAVTSPERMEKMAVHHDALYLGGSTIAQYALAKVLTQDQAALNKYVDNLRKTMQDNQKLLSAAFSTYGMNPLPVPATYYMIICHNRESDMAAMEELMAKKIVVTPLQILTSTPDKSTGYIRIHFAVSKETAQAVSDILTDQTSK